MIAEAYDEQPGKRDKAAQEFIDRMNQTANIGPATMHSISANITIPRNLTGNAHYAKLPIDPFQYSMANKLDALQHTIIKYVTRFRDKGGVRDLIEARSTIDRLIAHETTKGQA